MARRLVAAIVLVLLGVTPSLALACDARCLSGDPFTPSISSLDASESTGHAHAHHRATAAPAHTHHQVDAAVTEHGTQLTDAHVARHGCRAAFDTGALDRQAGAALAVPPSSWVAWRPGPCPTTRVARVPPAPPLPLSLLASVPLRI